MCLQDEVLVLQRERMSSERSEVRMCLQDGAKRSSGCFTNEERAERVLNVFAGRSEAVIKCREEK